MAKTIATVSGVALAPGVSRNGRKYTREAIAKAVTRAQARIADGTRPMTMLTHHAAEDDSTKIVGRVTSMMLGENGEARFTADIAGTPDGQVIASLLDTSDGQPAFLQNVSIRGAWAGKVRREHTPDGPVETSDDLELDGFDYTRKPGVDAARVEAFAWAADGASETDERVPITESVQEACVTISEAAATAETPAEVREALSALFGEAATVPMSKRDSGLKGGKGTPYADPGYQSDGKQRYELDTPAHIRAAWAYVNQAKNAKPYSAQQLKRIKGRIKAAAAKAGITITSEGWVIAPALEVTEALLEYMGGDPECAGSYSLSATNGPTTVTVCSYGLDPADLQVILAQACKGAGLALQSLDPDMDGDIDVPGADAEDTDDDAGQDSTAAVVARMMAALKGESAEDADALFAEAKQAAGVTETAPADPAPDPAAAPQGKEPAVSEATTTEAAGTAPAAATIPPEVLEAAVAKAIAKRDKKAAKKAARETAKPGKGAVTETAEQRVERLVAEKVAAQIGAVTETEEAKIERLVAERITAERQRITESGGGPARKGLSPEGAVNEHTAAKASMEINPATDLPYAWGDKPLHDMDQETFDRLSGPALVRHVLKDRADLLA